jgi:hypothetical protein
MFGYVSSLCDRRHRFVQILVDDRHRHSATCIVSAPAACALSDDDDDDDGEKNSLGEAGVRRARTFSGNSCLPPLVRQQGHSATSAPSMSYSRAERSPLAPYYSSVALHLHIIHVGYHQLYIQ